MLLSQIFIICLINSSDQKLRVTYVLHVYNAHEQVYRNVHVKL